MKFQSLSLAFVLACLTSSLVAQSINCPTDINQAVDPGNCTATVTVPMATFTPTGTNDVALNFDGSNDYTQTALLTQSTDFTMEVSFKASPTALGFRTIMMWQKIGPNHETQFSINPDGFIRFGQFDYENSQFQAILGSTFVRDGYWHHVAAAKSGNQWTLYVDGVQEGTMTLTATNQAFNDLTDFSVGASQGTGGAFEFFEGDIDDVRIWNDTRTQVEIQNNIGLILTGTEPDLRLLYNYEEGTPCVDNSAILNVPDLAGNDDPASFFNFNLDGSTGCDSNYSSAALLINDYNDTNDASDVYGIGTTTVTWTYFEGAASASCSQLITVTESTPPTLTCPSDITSDCIFDPITYNVTVTDNCSNFPPLDLPGYTPLGTFQNKTYFLSDTAMIPSAAYTDAIAQGGTVATMEDAATNTFVRDAVTAVAGGITVIIGYDDVATEGTFEWQSGSFANYTNWFPGEPNDFDTGEDYTQMAGSGVWNDINDTFSGRYVLEFFGTFEQTAGLPSGASFPTGTTTNTFEATDFAGNMVSCSFDVTISDVQPPVVTCPADIVGDCSINPITYSVTTNDNCGSIPPLEIPGFTSLGTFQNKTYFLSDIAETTANSFTTALGLGATVATIEDAATNTYIRDAVTATAGGIAVTIGFNDTATEGDFEWQSGGPIIYTNWTPGEPNDFNTGEDYAAMLGNGLWNDINDVTTLRYVIEYFGTFEQTAGLPSGVNYPVGTTTNTFVATDYSGNTATCSFDVTITDTTPVTITCPADIVQDNDPGLCGAYVEYPFPTPSEDCNQTSPFKLEQFPDVVNLGFDCTSTQSNHLRIFDLNTEGVVNDYFLESINVGIAFADATQNFTVNLYLNDQIQGNVTEYAGSISSTVPPFATATVASPATNATIVNVPFNLFIPASSTIYVEVVTPDSADFLMGYFNNNAGETAVGYINCGGFYVPSNTYPTIISVEGGEYLNQTTIQTAGLSPNSLFPVGTTTNTFEVTDGNGNTASCSFDVTVNDVEVPTVTCPSDIIVDNEPGICGATVEYLVTGFDNCSNAPLPGFEMIGFTNEKVYYLSDVRFTALDAYADAISQGGFVASIPSVEINDLLVAGANAKSYSGSMIVGFNDLATEGSFVWQNGDAVTYTNWDAGQPDNAGAGEDYTIISGTTGLWSDVVETFSIRYVLELDNNLFNQTAGLSSGSEFPVGITTNTFEYTDAAGNTASCSFDVTVNDIEAPVAVCQDITIQLDATGNATIVATDVDGGSTDNCAVTDYQIDIDTFTCADVGNPVTVTLTVFDDALNSDTCTAVVTVEDVTPPTITCPADLNVDFDANCEFELLDYTGLATVSDACDTAPGITQSPPAGTFITTTTTITITVIDASGNSASCTFDVIPSDNTPPSLTCPSDQTEDLDANCEFTLPDYTGLAIVSDNCDANPILTQNPPSGTVINSDTLITISAEDIDGNQETCTFNVILVDTTPPVIICPATQNESVDASCLFTVPDYSALATATDNCTVISITQTPTPGTIVGLGTTVIILEANDGTNTSSCMFDVVVSDTTAPTAICQDFTAQLDALGMVVLNPTDIDNGSFDNCSPVTLSVAPNTFGCVDVGTPQTVTLTVTDDAGNSSTCTAVVTVEDNLPPVANCMDITIILDPSGMATIVPTDVDAGSTDNCAIASTSISQDTFTCDDVGPNDVTLTVTDVNGNVSTCIAVVTVTETIAPLAVCQDITIQLDAMGMATIIPTDIDGGSSDNCEIASLSVNTDTFNCADVGPNMVTLTVTDTSGNSSSCMAIVTVEDSVAPDAVCQDITIQLNSSGMASIVPGDIDGGSSDTCGIASLTIDQDMFDCSNVGPNNVTLTVIDVNGNESSCVAVVTVEEENAIPVAVCQNITAPLGTDGTVTISPNAVNAGSTGAGCVNGLTLEPNTFDCSDVGAPIQVTLTVTNGNGDTDSCTALVNIVDTLAPTITCPEDQVVTSEGLYTVPDYVANGLVTVTDNCETVTTITQNPPPGTMLEQGEYLINFTATDPSNNMAECFFRLTIEDLLGTNEADWMQSLTIYPNPATNEIHIANSRLTNDPVTIEIYDLTGRAIWKKTYQQFSNVVSIPVHSLASATYILMVGNNNEMSIKQFIKE